MPECVDVQQHASSQATIMVKWARTQVAGLFQATALLEL